MGTSQRSFATVLALLAALAPGCGKEDGKGGEGGGAGEVPRMAAAEFYGDYSSLKGADLFDKYSAGVVVFGPVKELVNLGADEGLQLLLEVDGPGHIAAKFQDGGAGARQKKLKAGDQVELRCQINGKPEAILFLVDCAFEPQAEP